MRFEYVPCVAIPKLAWCAYLRHGSEVVRVYHGPWVETRDEWFVEGAWTGPFERGEIDSALFNVGSGGVLRAGRAVFCTQTDMIERLYSLRTGGQLFISNSLAFVLTMAGDEPDPRHPFYRHELEQYILDGISRKYKAIRTRLGRRVQLHDHCQIAACHDLRLARIEKPVFPRPANFDDYVSLLRGVLRMVLENASSAGRRHRRYEGLATVSGGYDSNALAALLAKLDVREAMTFYDKRPGDDSGEEVAAVLGLSIRVYGRTDFRTMPDLDEAEFLSVPGTASDIVFAPCEEQLVGKVLVTGRAGDGVLGNEPTKFVSDFRMLHASGAGARLIEFRLRAGFLNFNPLYAGALHLPAIREITKSPEMRPWCLGGTYDRPIARRILEEGGVPRGLFGTRKGATAFHHFRSPADMSAEGRADFESYRRSMPRPGLLHGMWYGGRQTLLSACDRAVANIKSFWWTGGTAAESLLRRVRRWRDYDDMDFAMHWGQARVRQRYAEAATALASAEYGLAIAARRGSKTPRTPPTDRPEYPGA